MQSRNPVLAVCHCMYFCLKPEDNDIRFGIPPQTVAFLVFLFLVL